MAYGVDCLLLGSAGPDAQWIVAGGTVEDKDEVELSEEVPETVSTLDADAGVDEEGEISEPDGGEDETQAEIQQLKTEIEQLKSEVLRAYADSENTRKRAVKDVESAHKYGVERLISDLLPVKDSLDMGLDAAASASDVQSLTEGMELTAKMFGDFFDKFAVTELDPEGEQFDPEFHQAMTVEKSDEAPPGTVLKVMQKGILLNDRLVRPALVIVAKDADEST